MENDEKQLIHQLKNQKTRDIAFHLLVKRFQERLYWHIRKIVLNHDDADDVLQNTFVNAWRALDNFREESKLYTWLYRIATNEALKHLENIKRKSTQPMDDKSVFLQNNIANDDFFSGEEAQKILQQAILTLPDKQRLVFNMKYFDDMKYQEIAEVLDTSIGALKASYHHAVKKIEEYIRTNDLTSNNYDEN